MRLIVLLLALGLLASCSEQSSGENNAARSGVTEGTLHILSLVRVQGYAEGIPCDANDISPIAAAAELRDRLRSEGEHSLLVAVGDSLVPTQMTKAVSKVRLLRFPLHARGDVILDALAAADVDVYLPGHADLMVSPDRIFDRCVEAGLPVLISNLQQPARPDVKRYMVVTADNLRIGLLSLLSPNQFGPSSDGSLKLEAVVPCAIRLAASLRETEGVDLVVVLSTLASKANTTLLARLDGIDIIIGGTGDTTIADRILIVGSTAIMSSKAAGGEVGHTTISIRDGEMRMTDLSPRHQLPRQIEYAEEEWARYVRTYGTSDPMELARLVAPGDEAYFLRQVNLISQNRDALANLNDYVGSFIDHRAAQLEAPAEDSRVLSALLAQGEAIDRSLERSALPDMASLETGMNVPSANDCRSCHLQQFRFWEETPHPHAFEALSAMGRGRDPTCLECHTTGYQDPGGWFDPRLDAPLGGVTCFSCHLATTAHSNSPRRVVDPLYVVGDADRISCSECHNSRRSPMFDREALLPLVACPPMGENEPAIILARKGVLDSLSNRRERGITDERDAYLEARALLGLGRMEEGFDVLAGVATSNTGDPRLAMEIAGLLDGGGRSREAQESLYNYLFFNTGDPDVNELYVQLLLEALDEDARDPEQALAHLGFLIPDDPDESSKAFLSFRVLQIDALFAVGRPTDGFQLMWSLNRIHSRDPRLIARINRYATSSN